MTVSSTTTKVSLAGNGTAHSFGYTFKIFADADLQVFIRSSTGTETLKTLDTHYIVTGAGADSGGNVLFKFNTGNASDAHFSSSDFRPQSGETVVIKRVLTLTQGTDYVANDPFPAESHEDALDRLTFISQQQQEELDRSIKASVGNTITGAEFTLSATDRANKVFAFDASGNLSITQELGTFRGNWAASTAYAARDLVKDTSTNNIFIVTTAHTSSGSQPLTTNANSASYSLIVDAATATTSATTASTASADAQKLAINAEDSQFTLSDNTQGFSALHHAAKAAASATSAATAKTNAETALSTFQGQYHGAAGSDPTSNLDAGDLYFNTSTGFKVYNGSAWEDIKPTTSEQTNINAVATNNTNITTVAGQISPTNNIGTVASSATDIGTVAARDSDIGALAAIASDVTSLANAIGAATTYAVTVAQSGGVNVFYIDGAANPTLTLDRGNTYIFDQSDSSNAGHPLAFKDSSGNSYTTGVTVTGTPGQAGAKVQIDVASNAPSSLRYYCTVHGNAMGNTISVVNSNLATVASNITNVNNVGSNISSVNALAPAVTNINTLASSSNLSGINSFAERYRIGSSNPTGSLDAGDLFFNTTDNELKVYNGSAWVAATSAVNGTSVRQTYTVGSASGSYDGSTTVFPITYDVGFVDVYLNGVRLAGADFTATNGTSVTLGSAASSGDTVDMVAFGIFNVAAISAAALTSGTIPDARFPATLPAVSGANLTGINTDLVADSTPQLGGNLDVQTHSIVSTSNQDITVSPNGTGKVVMNTRNLDIIDDDDGSSQGPNITLFRDTASAADDDILGSIKFLGRDSNGGQELYGKISVTAEEVTHLIEGSSMFIEEQPYNVVQLFSPNSVNRFFNFRDQQILGWVNCRGTNHTCNIFWETPTSGRSLFLPNASGTVAYLALSTTTITSSTAAITIDNLPDVFNTFHIHINAHPVTDGVDFRARFLDNLGNVLSAANTYGYYRDTDGSSTQSDNSSVMQITGTSIGSANYEGVSVDCTLQNRNFNASVVEQVPPSIQGNVIGHYATSNPSGGSFYGMMGNSNPSPIRGIQFYFSSGNVARATVHIYGIQNT